MGVISTDLNPNAFVGLSLPFEVSNNGDFQKTKTLIEQTRSNIKNLLLTAKGERPNKVDVELKFSLSYDPSNTEEIVLYNLAANSDMVEGFEGTGDI